MAEPRKPLPPRPGQGTSSRIGEMLRVDHAGETAAVGIYRGQQKVFGGLPHKRHLAEDFAEMEAGEHVHLNAFNEELLKRGERPSALIGLWQGMSYALGVGTALLGEKAAHTCTEAVEDVIEKHYQAQIDELDETGEEPELKAKFVQFRADEIEHRDHAVAEGAHEAPGYGLLSAIIKTGCKAAIRISEKI